VLIVGGLAVRRQNAGLEGAERKKVGGIVNSTVTVRYSITQDYKIVNYVYLMVIRTERLYFRRQTIRMGWKGTVPVPTFTLAPSDHRKPRDDESHRSVHNRNELTTADIQ
jgi:hypothetical protein